MTRVLIVMSCACANSVTPAPTDRAPKKRGPKSRKNELADENAKLKRELERILGEAHARIPSASSVDDQCMRRHHAGRGSTRHRWTSSYRISLTTSDRTPTVTV